MKTALFRSSLRTSFVRVAKIEITLILCLFTLATIAHIVAGYDPCFQGFHAECTTAGIRNFIFYLMLFVAILLVGTYVFAIIVGVRAVLDKERKERARVLLNDTFRIAVGMPFVYAVFWVAWLPAANLIARPVEATIRFVEDVRR